MKEGMKKKFYIQGRIREQTPLVTCGIVYFGTQHIHFNQIGNRKV